MLFPEKLESVQYNAALAITGPTRGYSSENLYQELSLEFLQSRNWFGKLCQFYRSIKNKLHRYLFNIVPTTLRVHNIRYCHNIPFLKVKHNLFGNHSFHSSIVEWNKLSRESFWSLLAFNSIFDISNPHVIKLLTRLRLGLSHLNDHKFKYGFNDTINPIYICGGDIESINHFFIHCPEFS